jgi:hypothetical protein
MSQSVYRVRATGPRGPGLSGADVTLLEGLVDDAEAAATDAAADAAIAAAAAVQWLPRVVCEGDSIMAANHIQYSGHSPPVTYGNGELIWARAQYPYFEFDQWEDATDTLHDSIGCNAAVGGSNTADVLARIEDSANLAGDVICFGVPVNGINQLLTPAAEMGRVQQICEYWVGLGKTVLLGNLRPVGAAYAVSGVDWTDGSTRQTNLLALNALIETYAETAPGVHLIDVFSAYEDPGNLNRPVATYVRDYLHPSRTGAAAGSIPWLGGLRKVIKPILTARPSGASVIAGSDMSGTGGTASTGVTGDVASTWIITRSTSGGVGGSVAASKNADGEQVVEFTPGGSSWERAVFTKTSGGATMASGSWYKGLFHIVLQASDFWRGASLQFGAEYLAMGYPADILTATIPAETFTFNSSGDLEMFVESAVHLSAGETGTVQFQIIIDGASTDPTMVATIREIGAFAVADPQPLHGL